MKACAPQLGPADSPGSCRWTQSASRDPACEGRRPERIGQTAGTRQLLRKTDRRACGPPALRGRMGQGRGLRGVIPHSDESNDDGGEGGI